MNGRCRTCNVVLELFEDELCEACALHNNGVVPFGDHLVPYSYTYGLDGKEKEHPDNEYVKEPKLVYNESVQMWELQYDHCGRDMSKFYPTFEDLIRSLIN